MKVVHEITEDFLDALDKQFRAEETEGWRIPANRTDREYAARQARMAVGELRYKIAEYNQAVASAETQWDDLGARIVDAHAADLRRLAHE